MPASARDVRKALTGKLGFQSSHTDHEIFEFEHEGRVIAVTKISHQATGKDIGDKLLGMMARQCNVRGPVFRGAIACTVNRESFVAEMLSG